jgi:Concanavalin A-like lectin/glucanases superfamily
MKRILQTLAFSILLSLPALLSAQGGGTCADFDGTNDYLSLGGNYYQFNEFTTELWVYATDWTPVSDQIIITTNTNAGGKGWKIELHSSSVRFYLVADNTKDITVSTSGLTGWHHIAVTYDGVNMNLWLDGNSNATTAQTGSVDYPSSQTTLIGTHSDLTEDFDGYMDEIRFWNVALSQSQIQEWMNQPIISGHAPANVSNLRGYYKLDTDWPTSPNELDDCGNDVGGGASDRDLTNVSCAFSDENTPIGDFTTGYTSDPEALWRAMDIDWSDESTGLALQDYDAQSIGADEFYAFANNGLTGTNTSDLPADLDIRAATIWFIDAVAADNINLNFDLSKFGATTLEVSGLVAANYKLLRRTGTTGDFTAVASGSSISSGEVYFENYDLAETDAYFTIGRDNDLATVTTTAASSIGFMDATSGGAVISNGGSTVTEQGICWNKIGSPTISDVKKKDYSGQTPYSKSMYDFIPGETYYIRAYAINGEGTAYGNQVSFTTTTYASASAPTTGDGSLGNPYEISSLNELAWMMQNESSWDSYFELTADIDASATSSWDGSKGFAPIGIQTPTEDQFNGFLEGNNHVISNLYINRPNTNDVGLFGYTDQDYSKSTSYVRNLGLTSVNFTGGYRTAGLIGRSTSIVSNCYVTGSITGDASNSIAAGLIGQSHEPITNCYSTASVSAEYEAAGFVSFNNGTTDNCYSTGLVSNATNQFGFCNNYEGHGTGIITNSFWDTQTSGQATSLGGTGKTTSEMKTLSTFTDAGWDFEGETTNGTNDYWSIDGSNNSGYPWLSWEGYSPEDNTWDGFASTDWNTASNWSLDFIPSIQNNTIINSGGNQPVISTTETASCNNLTVNDGATLTIQSDASGTGSLIVNGASTGNVTMQRYLAAATWSDWEDGWHFVSSPVADYPIANNFTVATAPDYDFYAWSEPDNLWVNFKTGNEPSFFSVNGNSNNFKLGSGYMAAYKTADTKGFVGEINVENIPVTGLTITGAKSTYYSWHLLGNPFTSAIIWDVSGDWAKTNIGGIAQIWNEAGKSYSAIASGGAIPATNGFMVQAQDGTGSLTIPKNKRVHSTQAFYKTTDFPLIKLKAHNLDSPSFQESQILFNPESTADYEMEYDCDFLGGYAPQFYSLCADRKLCVNSMPECNESLKIPFTFIKNEGLNFSIEMYEEEGMSIDVWLLDRKSGNKQNLSENPTYIFTSYEGDETERFEIQFGVVGIEEQNNSTSNVQIWAANKCIHILNPDQEKGIIRVINMYGQVLAESQLNGNESQELDVNVSTGNYIVSIVGRQQTISKKVFVK